MKILFYFGGFAPMGGIETFCKNLLHYLQLKKYNVALVCWGKKSPLLQSLVNANLKIIYSPWRWGNEWNLPEWFLLPVGYRRVKNADIIIFPKYLPLKIVKHLRKQAKQHTKFILITPYRPHLPEDENERKKFIELLGLFNLIIVQAKDFENDLKKLKYMGETATIPYITHQQNFVSPYPVTENLRVGFLGRLVEDKNIVLLLNAFKKFQEKYHSHYRFFDKPNPSLHLFGEGHLKHKLQNLASELNINSFVFFHGAIPNDDIGKSITSCHIFAFSSTAEGQCIAALEILSFGRPIVATEAGAFPDILSDTRLGQVVRNATDDKFAEALMKISSSIDEEVISPESIFGAYMERYSPDKIGEQYEKMLLELYAHSH